MFAKPNIGSQAQEPFLDRMFAFMRRKKVNPAKTVGVAGTPVFGGWVQENEKLSALTRSQRYITYSGILANNEIVATGVRYFLNILAKSDWKVEKAKTNDPRAEEYADLIEDMMNNMATSWERIIRRTAMFRFYGFSVQEWTAKKRDDGLIGFEDIAPRAQFTITRWDTDSTGRVFGIVQESPQTSQEIYLPRNKTIYMVDDSLNDSPEGLGLFRHATIISHRLTYYLELEGYGFETDLRGIPVGRGPYAEMAELVDSGLLSVAQKQTQEAGLTDFIQNHIKNPKRGVLLDSETYTTDDEATRPSNVYKWDLQLLKGGSTSQAEVNKAIERETQSLARLFGVENLMLGSTSGSRALSEDKSANFALVIDSILKEIAKTYQKDFIERLFELNGWDRALAPTFKTEAIRLRDVEQVTRALKDMAQAGAPLEMDDQAINDVRDLIGVATIDLEARARQATIEDAIRREETARVTSTNALEEKDVKNADNDN